MDLNSGQNQSYWFVVREEQNNVNFSNNNFTIQNPQIAGQEQRYIVDTVDNRLFIQINEAPVVIQETPDSCDKESGNCKPNEDVFWERKKVKLLLNMCLDNRFKNINKDKSLWNEISLQLGTTVDECMKKYRNLRRTYIRLLKKKRLGKEIKWVHYNICEEVFKECKSLPASVLEPWEDYKVRKMLTLYLENLNKFRNPDCLQKDIWKEIAFQVGTTDYNCYHKFKNLKRAYFNWLERSKQSGKPMKWQFHHYFERIYYNYSPSAGPWDRNKTGLLMNAYLQIADKFRNPRYQKKELWKDISTVVGESPSDCDKKFRNLKQTYIRLKMKANSGKSITKWRYFKDFETIYGDMCDSYNEGTITRVKPSEEDYVKELLTFYVENKEKFKDPLIKKKNLWKMLSPRIGLSTEECDRKYRNLKQTYIRLAERKKQSGRNTNWPYYEYFEKIFDQPNISTARNIGIHLDDITLSEIKRTVQELEERNESDKFEKLVNVMEESNSIERERNKILLALLSK